MISVYLQGGLGNQLFQIFTCISYALKHNIEFKLPIYNQNSEKATTGDGHHRPTYWDSFLINLKKSLFGLLYMSDTTLSDS